jgi:hypothetical protein
MYSVWNKLLGIIVIIQWVWFFIFLANGNFFTGLAMFFLIPSIYLIILLIGLIIFFIDKRNERHCK